MDFKKRYVHRFYLFSQDWFATVQDVLQAD